mgnify:CR=1 FL=1
MFDGMILKMNEIKIFDNPTNLDRAVAEEFRQNALKAQSEGRNFSVALCGGKTPYGVYARLAKLASEVVLVDNMN